jgi:hypothetical protein
VTTDGTKRLVNSLTWGYYSPCISLGVEQSVRIPQKSIEVDVGSFVLTLPFELIGSIRFEHNVLPDPYPSTINAIATLGDGSVVKGQVWGNFEGVADRGKVRIQLGEWASLAFRHKPEATSALVPRGKHSAMVQMKDGSQVVLTGATFLTGKTDKDGCYSSHAIVDMIHLKTGSTEYKVEWSAVTAIIQGATGAEAPTTVLFRDGRTRKGSAAVEIGGVASHVGHYKLQAAVRYSSSDEEIAKVELRD